MRRLLVLLLMLRLLSVNQHWRLDRKRHDKNVRGSPCGWLHPARLMGKLLVQLCLESGAGARE
jgi:hypothetical protein